MHPYLLILAFLWVFMTLWFVASLIQKRNDVADEAWGLGFILVCGVALLCAPLSVVGIMMTACVTVWGSRLFFHLHARHRRMQNEDPRYAQWRGQWRFFMFRSYLQIFLLQGALLFMIALPAVSVILRGGVLHPVAWLGFSIWVFGFLFEVIADKQLRDFIANEENKGKLMTQGLWRYSRHPNYFGEVTLWWGIYVVSLAQGVHPSVVIGPLTITLLILFVSGIPMTERRYAGREDFESYKKRTSAFLPLPPKRARS